MQAILLPIMLVAIGTTPSDPSATTDEVRAAIEKSIPFIENEGLDWIEQRDCVSCHVVGPMLWSLGDARRKGFAVDERLDEWFDWSLEVSLAENDKGKIVAIGNREGVAQVLWAAGLFEATPRRSDSRRELARLIATTQEENGTWKPGGQLPFQKRPKVETTEVSSMWLAATLARQDEFSDTDAAITKALQRIAQSKQRQSTEWYAARVLLAKHRNEGEVAADMIAKLREQQQADGGWGWIVSDPSDALGTGMVIYALLEGGVSTDDPAIGRAQRFLLDTHRDDGSWAVKGTKAKKKDKVEETAVYWGTTWATIALLRSLPD